MDATPSLYFPITSHFKAITRIENDNIQTGTAIGNQSQTISTSVPNALMTEYPFKSMTIFPKYHAGTIDKAKRLKTTIAQSPYKQPIIGHDGRCHDVKDSSSFRETSSVNP